MEIRNAPTINNSYKKEPTTGNMLSESQVSDLYKVTPTADPDLGKLYNAGIFDKEPTIGSMASKYQMPTPDVELTQDQFNFDLSPNETKDIQRNVLKQFQDEINSTKGAYSQLLSNVKQQGLGRLGEDTAVQSRRGLIGSDFGAAQTEKVRALNLSEEQKVAAAQAAALAGIKSQATQLAQSEISERRNAKKQGTMAWIDWVKNAPERKMRKLESIANSFLLQGFDPLNINQKELSDIAKGYGVTEADIITSYLSTKQAKDQAEAEAQAQLIKDSSFNLSEGQARYQYNPETGQVEMVASRAKTYKPTSSGSSTGGGTYNGKPLTSSQKTAVDNLDAVESSLNSYKQLYNQLVGQSGVNLTGQDAGQLAGAYNALIFQIAQAAGTGALQAADREVVEAMIPNPTTISGAVGGAIKGGKAGGIKAIEEAQTIFRNKRNAILGETPNMVNTNQSVKQQVEAAGYDYEAMKADGLSDQEILNSL